MQKTCILDQPEEVFLGRRRCQVQGYNRQDAPKVLVSMPNESRIEHLRTQEVRRPDPEKTSTQKPESNFLSLRRPLAESRKAGVSRPTRRSGIRTPCHLV